MTFARLTEYAYKCTCLDTHVYERLASVEIDSWKIYTIYSSFKFQGNWLH